MESVEVERDILILAGDIHVGEKAMPFLLEETKKSPVLYVLGNHEFYDNDIDKITEFWVSQNIKNLHVLERSEYILDNVRFLGCSLWTDFNKGDPKAMDTIRYTMSDFAVVDKNNRILTPRDVLKVHIESKKWLISQLEKPFTGTTVVITHHLPSYNSVSPRFRDNVLNYGFYSDLSELISKFQPDLWIHGHTHDSFNYIEGTTKIICNPRGYSKIEDNFSFNPSFTITL